MWTQTSAPFANWKSITSDSSGSQLTAAQNDGGIYIYNSAAPTEPTMSPNYAPTYVIGSPTPQPIYVIGSPTPLPTASPYTPTFSCEPYNASDTNNAQQNYDTCSYTFSGNSSVTVTATNCASYSGDTYLRAYINNNQVAANDDSCGGGSTMEFTIDPGQTVVIDEGCYASGSCSGTVVLSFSSTIVQPTNYPVAVPTYIPINSAWTQTSAPLSGWSCIVSDSTGQYLVATQQGGYIYTSSSGIIIISSSYHHKIDDCCNYYHYH